VQITVLVAMFIALLAGSSVESGPVSVWMGYFDARRSLVLLAGSLLIVWSLLRVTSAQVVRRMERLGAASGSGLRLPGRIDFLMRVLILTVFAAQLTVGSWTKQVQGQWHMHRFILLDELLLLLPFLVMILLHWHSFYPVNRYIREHIVAGQLAEGMAARPVWSRRQYISFNLRTGMLIILVPMLLIKGFLDLLEGIQQRWLGSEIWVDLAVNAAGMMGVAAIFILAPLLLRYIWLTRPLPAGPLRERLESFCRRMGLKTRDLLLWDTHSAVANAAVMGLFGRIRYVLLSDAVIENMPDDQIEAVFGHEAGHIKHHHIIFLVLFVMGAGSFVLLLGELGVWTLQQWILPQPVWEEYQEWLVSGWFLALIVLWALVFGWVSRRFERQADLHGAIIVANAGNPIETELGSPATADDCSLPSVAETNPGNLTRSLTERGARIFGSALIRIAMLNGISIDAHSWRHSSIGSRVHFLQTLAQSEKALQRFQRIVILIKVLIVLSVLIGTTGTVLLYWMSR
jgi:STE24 endopeptidase